MPQKQTKLTPEEALAALEVLPLTCKDEPSLQHISGDVILCQLLAFLGYDEVVEEYLEQAVKWDYT